MNKKIYIFLCEIVLLIIALCFFFFIRIQQSALVYIAVIALLFIVLKLFSIDKISGLFPKNFFFLGFLIIILQQLPYFILGTNSFLTIPDNLDFYVPRIKMLIDEHLLMNATGILPKFAASGELSRPSSEGWLSGKRVEHSIVDIPHF